MLKEGYLMVPIKSLDEYEFIAALLRDAHALHGDVFNTRALKLTCNKVSSRMHAEGTGFLRKTLPRLGKHLDQALTGVIKLNATSVGFETLPGSGLPRFLGEFFSRIFQQDGSLLPDPDANRVQILRDILYCYSKYKIPHDEVQEQAVIAAFKQAEVDLSNLTPMFANLRTSCDVFTTTTRRRMDPFNNREAVYSDPSSSDALIVVREARILLSRLFAYFDPLDIVPKHGPGVVATKQRLWEKYQWSNVSDRITAVYPFDAYFQANLGHCCDTYDRFNSIGGRDESARVLLVPKDSRGPRLISCEPVDFQWVQQGLRAAIYRLVENHELTSSNVFFTNQDHNRDGALIGSRTGRYATLDLKEASDRVHLDLVRLLFPEHLHRYLEAARSTSTVLPDGTKLVLNKFAPMGSALCFPILALTIWALLTAAAPNADTRERILVYGDDVIVPTTYVGSAITTLEAFGLLINRAKSCTQGLFRESCGMDAFQGVDVTPVRLRTVWDESPRPGVYSSYIAYANRYWDRRCFNVYDLIVKRLVAVYGNIPGQDMNLSCPSLRESPAEPSSFRRRTNIGLQKLQYKVRVVTTPSVHHHLDGWSKLLRFFTESNRPEEEITDASSDEFENLHSELLIPFSASRYTKRHASILVWRWR